jgi:flagellar hook-associated protein 1 FlgK
MSLTTSLNIGVSAINAFSAAIQNTSKNIANANTPGYSREVAQFSEATPSTSGGQGVVLEGFQSVRSELLQGQMQQQTQTQSKAAAQSSSLQSIQTAFTTSTQDIGTQMSALFTSISSLSANPSNASLRQGVLTASQNLATAFNTTSAAITTQQTASDSQVSTDVSQINTLTQQIAALNPQIAALNASGQDGGTLQDQQDQLLLSLSKLTDVAVTKSSDGDTVTTSAGTPLVIGSESLALESTSLGGTEHVLDSNGKDITSMFTSGDLGGNLQMRDQVLSGLKTSLDDLANQFGSAMNATQANGFDGNGNAGQNLFNLPSSAAGSAGSISVAITDPSLIAASSDGSAGSNGNLANLAAVQTTALSSGQTPTDTYASLVYSVGSLTANATAQTSASAASLLQLTDQNNSVSGVSIDEESTNLINFQQSYSAAARVVSTIQQLFQVVLNMGTPSA